MNPIGAHPTGKIASFFRFPVVWMIVGIISLTLVGGVAASGGSGIVGAAVLPLIGSVLALAVYWLVMRFLARRPVPEIAPTYALREALFGATIGAVFIIVSTILVVILGGYHFSWSPMNAGSIVVQTIATALSAAIVEELMFRGLALQAIEKMGGSWIGLAATSTFFGLAHLGNPGATIWSAIAITIEAGVLLGAGYLWRRNLWFVIGIHFAWNAVESLLGIPVSGHTPPGLFTVSVTGPSILTGGNFGIEASIVPVIISLLIAVPMLLLARHRQHLVPLLKTQR